MTSKQPSRPLEETEAEMQRRRSQTSPPPPPKVTMESLSEKIDSLKKDDGCGNGNHEYYQGSGECESVMFCRKCGNQISMNTTTNGRIGY